MSKETQSQIWRDAKKDFPEFNKDIWGARFIESENENGGFWDYFVCQLESLRTSKQGTFPVYERGYSGVSVDYWMPITEPPKPAEQ